MHATVASKLQIEYIRIFLKIDFFIHFFFKMPPLNFLLTGIYFFSKSQVPFAKSFRLFYTKNYAMFANNLEIKHIVILGKVNEAIYKYSKTQYLNMNILCVMASQTCYFLEDCIKLRPSTRYSLKSLSRLHISFDGNIQ